MVETINPARRALGKALKQWREAAGVGPAEVEAALEWHAGKNARVERGFRVPAAAEVERMLTMYRVPQSERAAIMKMHRPAKKRVGSARIATFANEYLAMEREAAVIRYWDDGLVSSLAQTEDYALALLAHAGAGDAEQRAPARLARQQQILDGPDAPEVRILLGEAVLYQEVGGPAVLRAQLEHLVDLVETRDQVSIRLIPFTAGAHRGLGVGFTHLEMRGQLSGMGQVYIEGFTDATYIHAEEEVAEYASAFDLLWSSVAADDARSVTMLRRRIDGIGGSRGSHTVA